MRNQLLLVLAVTAAVVALAGCSGQADPQARLDATGLKFMAQERLEGRAAQEARSTGAAHLKGFIRPLQVADGKVALTLEDVIRRAMANSLAIQVASYTPAMAEAEVDAASSAFDPSYFTTVDWLKTDQPNTAFLNIVGNRFIMEDTRNISMGITKPFVTGGSLTLAENFRYFKTNSPLTNSPTYGTDFTLELSQPLLRNLGPDASKAQIYIASFRRDATIDQFRGTVMDLLTQVEATYWGLVFAIRDVAVRDQSVALAEETYRKEKNREAQQMAKPVDVSRAKAAVTARKAELIRAQNQVRNLSDHLKNLLDDPELGLLKDVQIEPADEPMIVRPNVDRQSAAAAALTYRPELAQARNLIKALEAQVRYDQNQLLPQLDATFTWRRNSLAGTPARAYEDQWTGRFTDYGAGLKLQVPIGNRLAEARARRSQLELAQARRNLDKLVQDVILDVNTAIREVETNLEEIVATREARIAARETLDGEQASFEVGETTNDELLRVQADYEAAQRAEIEAVTRLNTSAMALERAKGTLLDYNNIHVVPQDYQNEGRRTDSAIPVPDTSAPEVVPASAPAAPSSEMTPVPSADGTQAPSHRSGR